MVKNPWQAVLNILQKKIVTSRDGNCQTLRGVAEKLLQEHKKSLFPCQ
jgi:hypothetical protein